LNSTLRSDRFRGRWPAISFAALWCGSIQRRYGCSFAATTQNTAQLACGSTAPLARSDSGSLRSSTWVSKTLLNCPCDPVVERSCGSGMRCRLASGSLGHAVKLNELKFVRFRTLEQIYQGIAIQTVNFYPAAVGVGLHGQIAFAGRLLGLARLGHWDPRGRAPCRAHSVWNGWMRGAPRCASCDPLSSNDVNMLFATGTPPGPRRATWTGTGCSFGDGSAIVPASQRQEMRRGQWNCEVVQSNKGLWLHSAVRWRWKRCVRPHLGSGTRRTKHPQWGAASGLRDRVKSWQGIRRKPQGPITMLRRSRLT